MSYDSGYNYEDRDHVRMCDAAGSTGTDGASG